MDSVTDHRNKASRDLAGGGFCLPFGKKATSVRSNKVKHNKTRFACKLTWLSQRA